MKSLLTFLALSISLCWPILAADTPPPSAALTVTSPRPWQVIQRNAAGNGTVEISGTCDQSIDAILYRVTGQPLRGKILNEWKHVPIDTKTHTFRDTITLAAGGWYRLEVEGKAKGETIARGQIDEFGIGEIFLIAGQSNAANHGAGKQHTQSRRVASFDGSTWAIANDPLKGASGNGGSFMPCFGDALVSKWDVPIGLIPIAAGGTSVREWLPKGILFAQQPTTGANVVKVGNEFESTGALFGRLSAALKPFGKDGIRAVLWHQGESDAGQARSGYPADRQISGAQYAAFMKHLIEVSQKEAGWTVPWITAVSTYHSEKDAADEEFRTAQQSLWKSGLSHPGPDTDALRAEFRDGVHFNAAGLKRHGELWAECVLAWLK